MHNSQPHGEKVMQPHELKDHLFEKKSGVAKLPDSQRETWHKEKNMYPLQPENDHAGDE